MRWLAGFLDEAENWLHKCMFSNVYVQQAKTMGKKKKHLLGSDPVIQSAEITAKPKLPSLPWAGGELPQTHV